MLQSGLEEGFSETVVNLGDGRKILKRQRRLRSEQGQPRS